MCTNEGELCLIWKGKFGLISSRCHFSLLSCDYLYEFTVHSLWLCSLMLQSQPKSAACIHVAYIAAPMEVV